jgi:hypothetical protein
LKDKGRRDYTLTSAIPGPSSGVHFTGDALYDFEAVYTLAETRTGWRIAAIAHNQIPRLLACIARRQSGK